MALTNRSLVVVLYFLLCQTTCILQAQPLGQPDRSQPGDRMIQAYLARHAERIYATFAEDVASLSAWQKQQPQYRQEFLHMLGLWPLPKRTPLQTTTTRTLRGDGYIVDMVHYQSRPGLYVTGNLYRPDQVGSGERLPAILYVCGHAGRGRNGNKTAYQSHGIWFARHGYLCLVLDTLQLGEIAAVHHGTYQEERWWWHARGYTSAGVECWNGMRGIDYLASRTDVDPHRIAVTGISGGGAATLWIAAADERVNVAVPVSGMADLISYVPNRVINGHCDCMFFYNTYEWPWVRIAALIAPRPMLFVNSDQDDIFPMDANDRVVNRLERVYSLYGAGDAVDNVVSIGGHAYRTDIRQAVFRFLNSHLKNDPRAVTDSEVDLVTGSLQEPVHPIEPKDLRVFLTDEDIPSDELNTQIDRHFVDISRPKTPGHGEFTTWKKHVLRQLRAVSLRALPERIPIAEVGQQSDSIAKLETEPGIHIYLRQDARLDSVSGGKRVLLCVTNPDTRNTIPKWLSNVRQDGDRIFFCDVRGVGETRWTVKNPPNYVERSLVLVGRTVDSGRIWDVAAAARSLRAETKLPVHVVGAGRWGMIGAYAALLEPDISGVILEQPPLTHMGSDAPQLLNVMRVCDIPEVLGMLAPKPLTLHGENAAAVGTIYEMAVTGRK